MFEVGSVVADLVWLREIDVISHRKVGSWIRAIAINIGGVNLYRSEKGKVSVGYVAPWSPDENIFCAMGYGLFISSSQVDAFAALVTGLRAIKAVTFPLPWHAGKAAAKSLLEQWRQRDWVAYMNSHVSVPFLANVAHPDGAKQFKVGKLVTETVEEFQSYGLYYELLTREAASLWGHWHLSARSRNAHCHGVRGIPGVSPARWSTNGNPRRTFKVKSSAAPCWLASAGITTLSEVARQAFADSRDRMGQFRGPRKGVWADPARSLRRRNRLPGRWSRQCRRRR